MEPATALPDYNRLASVFDRYLSLIEPVGSAVIAHLPPLADGAHVLDAACGTGEPGLTLARRQPDLHLVGIDSAAGMLELARAKAVREGLSRVRFEVMAAEAMTFPDGSMDAVLSRFGLLMFGDRAASARQMVRVLRIGGAFSLAVWDDMATNTLVRATIAALRPYVPEELVLPFERFEGAVPVDRLRDVGLAEVQTSPFDWDYEFSDEDAVWQFVSRPGIFERPFAALPEADKDKVRSALTASLAPYRNAEGYRIPHTCRLFWGRR